MSDVFYAGMIPFYLATASECGFAWCSESDPGVSTTCDFWTGWEEASVFFPDPEFGAASVPFTEGTNPNNGHTGLVVECAESNYPTPLFQVGSMIRTSAMPNTGTGVYVFVALENFYQLMSDADNFRCVVEISNFVDPGTGRRRSASFRIDSATPTIQVATYGYDADGNLVDFESAVISPIIPAPHLVSATFELDSYDGIQEVIINGGSALLSFSPTAIGESGGYQAVTMWWDVQFGSCGDATSPVIVQATGGEICDFVPTAPCYSWEYQLPVSTNAGSAPYEWEVVNDPVSDSEPDGGSVTRDRDFYYLPNRDDPLSMMQEGCDGYTATFEIFQIPGSVPAALQAFLESYVTTTALGPYSAFAQWQWTWAGATIDISITCFYYWPLGILDPDISFETSWSLNFSGAGTPGFAYPQSGSSTTTHGITGVYTITDAELPSATAIWEATGSVGSIDDVVGPMTMTQ